LQGSEKEAAHKSSLKLSSEEASIKLLINLRGAAWTSVVMIPCIPPETETKAVWTLVVPLMLMAAYVWVSASMSLSMIASSTVSGAVQADIQVRLERVDSTSVSTTERPQNATSSYFSKKVCLFLGFTIPFISWMPWGHH